MTNGIEGAMPPLPKPTDITGYPDGIEWFTANQLLAYAAPLVARVAELQAELSRARSALESISEMTYDSWTNGARAKQIADAAIAAKD